MCSNWLRTGNSVQNLLFFFFWWRGLIHSKGARTAAASTPIGRAALPAPMRRAAHAVESKAVVRIEVAVSPRPCCLGCAVELVLRVAPLRRGVPPR
jgi:hypothetical protein